MVTMRTLGDLDAQETIADDKGAVKALNEQVKRAQNRGGGELSHLYRRRSNSRDRLAILLMNGCEITQHKNFWRAGQSEIWFDLHASCAVGWRAQQFSQR